MRHVTLQLCSLLIPSVSLFISSNLVDLIEHLLCPSSFSSIFNNVPTKFLQIYIFKYVLHPIYVVTTIFTDKC